MNTNDISTIATLIGSRICHDLASPIGAITNGLELLELSGAARTPELDLLAQSVVNANARIRLYRLVFGHSSRGQMTGGDDVRTILRDLYRDGRIRCTAFPDGAFPRAEIRLVLLALLCMEPALPQGGDITVTHDNGAWRVTATGPRLVTTSGHWLALQEHRKDQSVTPADVQFTLLPLLTADSNMSYVAQASETDLMIEITPA